MKTMIFKVVGPPAEIMEQIERGAIAYGDYRTDCAYDQVIANND